MEHWLELLQNLGKRVPQFLAMCLVLVVAALGVYQWQKPVLQQLREKDSFRYEKMVEEASRLHWVHAWRQYGELNTIGAAQLHQEQYQRWKRQWEQSGEFRQSVLERKTKTQKEFKQSLRKKYDREVRELEEFRQKPDAALLKVHWEHATSWQKSLILRDRCIRYLNQELEDYRKRRHVKESLHGAALLAHSRISNASPGSLCREMVPLNHDDPSVHQSLLKLRDQMNYYYFSRLLKDIGIPDHELFAVSDKLDGMTRDFNGF